MTKPKAGFVVYVDESGNEGFAFKGPRTGSSQRYRVRTIFRGSGSKAGRSVE
jgi:hypothetical protein